MSEASRLPVAVVSGFLGSGKTTLIRALLADPRAGEIAVIVNEFGEVGIDHHLLRKTDERTTLLPRGCVCCGKRDDLAAALRDLLSGRGGARSVDRVVIETTGLADPVPIVRTLVADPVLRHHYALDRVVVALDAVAGATNLAAYGEAVRQVAAADLVVVTKRDLAPDEAPAALRAAVRRLNPTATVIDADHGRIDPEAVFALHGPVGLGDIDRLVAAVDAATAPAPLHGPSGRVATACFVFDRPLDWRMFGIWLTLLLHRHGDRVLRVKGLLNVGAASGPLLLEGVQHVMHAPRHLPDWPDADRRSRLVVILRDLDPGSVRASLDAFLAAADRVAG